MNERMHGGAHLERFNFARLPPNLTFYEMARSFLHKTQFSSAKDRRHRFHDRFCPPFSLHDTI
jgi:hypothetical protein